MGAQLLMPDSLAEKLLLILMEDGAHMVEVPSLEKINQRSIGLLPTMVDMLPSQWLPMVLLTDASFKSHMLLVLPILFPSMLTLMEQLRKDLLMMILLELSPITSASDLELSSRSLTLRDQSIKRPLHSVTSAELTRTSHGSNPR